MFNALGNAIGRFITAISEATQNFGNAVSMANYSTLQIALDILLVAILFYWFLMVIRGTRATNILLGFLFLAIVFAVSRWLNLFALGWLLDRLLTVILVAIPIIFQQELRRGLEKLGKTKFFMAQEAKEIDLIRSNVISACFEMAKQKIGALIVFRGEVSLKEYLDTGVPLDARVTKELLLSLFMPQSVLHDGAVIIDRNRIISAGCVLPHSFKEYKHTFGTRHKAALALSEITDAKIFVVSEQRGEVSFVSEGNIEEAISPQRAEELFATIFAPKKLFIKNRNRRSHVQTPVA